MALVFDYSDIEFLADLNDILKESPTASQRDIGESLGVSVAVVNGLIKRCLGRGWIAVSRLDGRKLRYMLSAEGLTALMKRSIFFMQRNFDLLSTYKKNIDASIVKAKEAGKRQVVLYGRSKVDFILKESCRGHGMDFKVIPVSVVPGDCVISKDELAVIGESVQADACEVAQGDGQMATVFALAK